MRDLVAQHRPVVVQLARHRGELRQHLVAPGVGAVQHGGTPSRVQYVGTVAEHVVDDERTALIRDDRAPAPERREVVLLSGQLVDRALGRGLSALQLVVTSLRGVVLDGGLVGGEVDAR